MIEKKSLQTEDTGRRRDAYKQQGYFRKRRNPDVLLAFLLTGLLLTCLFMIIGLYPFGSHTILNSDLNAQYAPDLAAYKTQLASGGNLSYSFLIGMGKNTMGLFAYYLASPLNFITFLFPTSMISESTLLLITIKLCLAASFLTLYLRRRFRAESHFAVVFGILYAFSSYSMDGSGQHTAGHRRNGKRQSASAGRCIGSAGSLIYIYLYGDGACKRRPGRNGPDAAGRRDLVW